jgi:putative oxidoreductase
MKKMLFSNQLPPPLLSVALLLLRCAVALMMFLGHGLPKLQNFDELRENFAVPTMMSRWLNSTTSLALTIFAEVLCCGLLVFGLATRCCAALLAIVMLIAAFSIHGSDPFFYRPDLAGGFKELALLYVVPTVFLVLTGSGSYALDARLSREKRRMFR